MEQKSAKKLVAPIIIGLVVILVIVGAVWLVIRNNNKNTGDTGSDNSETTSESTVTEAENTAHVTADELSPEYISETVTYGDYTAMFTLSKAIQNGEKVGAVVSIDGIVRHPFSSYSVVQANPEKAAENEMSEIGTVFIIQDAEESTYPADDERVKITAKVVEVSPLNFQLLTLPDFIEVVHETTE